MNLKGMTLRDVASRGIKKATAEITSVKFWGAVFIGYLNYTIVIKKEEFDVFGMFAFLALLGIREAADYLGKKT
jgi:fucose permease